MRNRILPEQSDLFGIRAEPAAPPGFRYQTDFLSGSEERALIGWIETLTLKPFEFRGFLGNRRVASFGFRYDYHRQALGSASPLPSPLLELRDRAAKWAGLDPARIQQSLVSEYRPGASIGWHTDKPQFEQVLGVSLLASSLFRLRRLRGEDWERRSMLLEPRSIYLLAGEVRREWQHSIPPLTELRYSITLRCLTADFERQAARPARVSQFSE